MKISNAEKVIYKVEINNNLMTWMTTPVMLCRDMTMMATVQFSVVARPPYLEK